MGKFIPHIGMRTGKTAFAVALALLLAYLLGSETPIFAAIGAISVMGRTVDDSLREGVTQFCGTLAGFFVACAIVTLAPDPAFFLWPGLGVLLVMLLCLRFRLYSAVALASIVLVDICLYAGESAQVLYGFHRFTDTVLGILVALAVNIAVKPYNNRGQIASLLKRFLRQVPACVSQRVVDGRYPALDELTAQAERIAREITIYEQQYFPRHAGHEEQAVFFRGCAQLAQSIVQELRALCAMDEQGRLSPANAARLAQLGIDAPDGLAAAPACDADTVANYHLGNLLDAYGFLQAFLQM